jgi:hypothetical protein
MLHAQALFAAAIGPNKANLEEEEEGSDSYGEGSVDEEEDAVRVLRPLKEPTDEVDEDFEREFASLMLEYQVGCGQLLECIVAQDRYSGNSIRFRIRPATEGGCSSR